MSIQKKKLFFIRLSIYIPGNYAIFLIVLKQIPAQQSTVSSVRIVHVLLHRIDCSNSSYISILVHASSSRCVYVNIFLKTIPKNKKLYLI